MKLELIGHDEKYAVEQSLLTLFPDERPVYGPVTDEDASAARITLTEGAAAATPPPTATSIPSPARTTKRKGSAVTRWA